MNYHSRAQEVEWITSLDIELKLLSVKGTLGLQVIVSRSNVKYACQNLYSEDSTT